MIKITIQKSNSVWIGFISKGHAGYHDKGQDIVCAAVSVLIINTINSIEVFSPETIFHIEESDGLINFKLECIPNEKVELLLNSMELGLKNIENEYKKIYIKLKFVEV